MPNTLLSYRLFLRCEGYIVHSPWGRRGAGLVVCRRVAQLRFETTLLYTFVQEQQLLLLRPLHRHPHPHPHPPPQPPRRLLLRRTTLLTQPTLLLARNTEVATGATHQHKTTITRITKLGRLFPRRRTIPTNSSQPQARKHTRTRLGTITNRPKAARHHRGRRPLLHQPQPPPHRMRAFSQTRSSLNLSVQLRIQCSRENRTRQADGLLALEPHMSRLFRLICALQFLRRVHQGHPSQLPRQVHILGITQDTSPLSQLHVEQTRLI